MKKALPQIEVIELNKPSAEALKDIADCMIKIGLVEVILLKLKYLIFDFLFFKYNFQNILATKSIFEWLK
ncbi:hypothetical protein P4829_10780 [Bacillus atrophaeus]|uniref:hypothetical protein n=1 Tax=Bacillus atrophaeus TaxID=1452 RepID=UPI0007C5C1CB|nr:hypothetical protein [Bacillus atrophaeus]WFE12457.1 hypothetical protein P4829_10780 [Bacillus atrophaeus]